MNGQDQRSITIICPHEFALGAITQELMDLHLEGWGQSAREVIFEVQRLVQAARADAQSLVTGRQLTESKVDGSLDCGSPCDPEHLARKFTDLAKEFARLGAVFLGCVRHVQGERADELVDEGAELAGPEDTDVRARLLEVLAKTQQVVADLVVEIGGVGDE